MYLFLTRVFFAIFTILVIVSLISIFNKKLRNKKIYIALPIVLILSIVIYNMGINVPKTEPKKEYTSISELFEDKVMANWTDDDARVLVELYNSGQVLKSNETTDFVYYYNNLNDECKEIAKDVYSSEKVKEDERIKKFKEEENNKTEAFNKLYSNIPYNEDKDSSKAIGNAKDIVTSKINEAGQIKNNFKIIDAAYNKMTIEVLDSNFTEGGAVAVQNIIFDAYTTVGLSRGVNYPIEITAVIKCGKSTREASWQLGKSPVRN